MRRRRSRRRRGAGSKPYDFFDLCSGLPLRLVEAIFSSSFSLIDDAIDLDAPRSLLLGVSPRLADRAAPAAFCWAADLAGMVRVSLSGTRQSNASAAGTVRIRAQEGMVPRGGIEPPTP